MKKQIYILFSIILLSSFVTASVNLDQGAVSYFSFDVDFGDDWGNASDCTAESGATRETTGQFLGAGVSKYNAGTDDLACGGDVGDLITNQLPFTLSFWYNADTITSDDGLYDFSTFAGSYPANSAVGFVGGGNAYQIYGGGAGSINYAGNLATWTHHVVRQNATHLSLFKNGTQVASFGYSTAYTLANYNLYIGGYYNANQGFDGLIDEFGVWKRALETEEISALFNDGEGCNPIDFSVGCDDAPSPQPVPTVVLNTPTNDTTINKNNNTFNYTPSTEFTLDNCSLWGNFSGAWGLNQTDESITNGTINSFNSTLDEGIYIWNVECFDNNSNSSFADNNFTLTIDINPPIIDDDFINGSRYFTRNLTTQINLSDNILLHSYNISIDGITIINETHIHESFFQINFTYDISNLTQGYHNFTISASDAHTAEELKDAESYNPKTGVFDNYMEFEFIAPYKTGSIRIKQKDSSIFDKWSYTKEKDKYKFKFNPNKKSNEYSFEVEADDEIYIYNNPNSEYVRWLVYEDHWFDLYPYGDDLTINRINKNKVELILLNVDPNLEELEFSSIGDLNTNTVEYVFFSENYTESFEATIFNEESTDYLFNINGLNHSEPGVVLVFNETHYDASVIISNTTLSRYKVTLTPVFTFSNEINKTHFWIINSTDNTSEQIQTIKIIEIAPCGVNANSTFPILNISYFDEHDDSEIFTNNSYNLAITDGTLYYNQTGTLYSNQSHSFCTNLNPVDVNFSWSMWNTMSITNSEYETRLFTISEGAPLILNNEDPPDLSINMIKSNESSTIVYTWTTTAFQPIDGVMQVFKCNSNGSKSLSDSVPIVSGQAVSNIQLITTQYAYTVVIGSKTYSQASFFTCHVEPSTTATYRVAIDISDVLPVIGLLLSECGLSKVDNETANMTWKDNPSDSSEIEGCFISYKDQVTGRVKIGENCSTSPINSIELKLVNDGSAYYVIGELRQSGNTLKCENALSFFSQSAAAKEFGASGIFAVVLLILGASLIFVGEGKGFLVAATGAIVAAWIVGLASFDWILVSSIIAFVTIIAIVGKMAVRNE